MLLEEEPSCCKNAVKDFILKNKDLKILIYSCFIDKLRINCQPFYGADRIN